jgi:hypothetical protein
MLMCRSHWFSLPQRLRRAIGATFRTGQIKAYQANIREAIDMIEEAEGCFTGIFEKPKFIRSGCGSIVSTTRPRLDREGVVFPPAASSQLLLDGTR